MKLFNTKKLHKELLAKGYTRGQFKVEYEGIPVTVAFFAEGSPYLLGVLIGQEPFIFQIHPGYLVQTSLPYSEYCKLASCLGFSKERSFHLVEFLQFIENNVPPVEEVGFIPPWLALKFFTGVQDPSKAIFLGFQKITEGSPSASNLEKTKYLLGEEAYNLCMQFNLSSKWGRDPSKSLKVLPELLKLRSMAKYQ